MSWRKDELYAQNSKEEGRTCLSPWVCERRTFPRNWRTISLKAVASDNSRTTEPLRTHGSTLTPVPRRQIDCEGSTIDKEL